VGITVLFLPLLGYVALFWFFSWMRSSRRVPPSLLQRGLAAATGRRKPRVAGAEAKAVALLTGQA